MPIVAIGLSPSFVNNCAGVGIGPVCKADITPAMVPGTNIVPGVYGRLFRFSR